MCCIHQKQNIFASLFSQWDFRSMPSLCQQGLLVSGSLNGVWLNDILSLFVKSLASFLPAGSKLGWRDTGDENMKVQVWETFMYYEDTTLSVRRQVMQNHFSSASHSLGSICTHFSGFFRSIQSLPPSLSLHPTWVTLTLQGSEGRGGQNKRKRAEGKRRDSWNNQA